MRAGGRIRYFNIKPMKTTLLIIVMALTTAAETQFWGFYAHKKINRLAVFTLPAEMIGFFKANIDYIEEAAVNPDKRRYAVAEEAPRHFLDADHYGDDPFDQLPRRWSEAVRQFGDDSLQAHGILPWHLFLMYQRLRDAFIVNDGPEILRLSAELGHYVADAHVPLHTTKNYNGQFTGQEGIHGFWESRLPELFSDEYDFFVGRAVYISDPLEAIWGVVISAHELVGEVLRQESILAQRFAERKYSFETRGGTTVRVYAEDYARAYHRALDGMVEKQMRASVKMTGDLWYTAWIDAGQPDLSRLIDRKPTAAEIQQRREELERWKATRLNTRTHD